MKNPSEWSQVDFESILYFGYHPDIENASLPEEVRHAAQKDQIKASHSHLVNQAVNCIEDTFERCIRNISPDKKHIVPLSGGLDSRLILAALLHSEKINSHDIRTVTFGSPQTWDFELSKQVAQIAGVENTTINLKADDISWELEDLVNTAVWAGHPVPILEARVNKSILDRFNQDKSVIWSGFMGDPSVGSHQPINPNARWSDAITHFISNNKKSKEIDIHSSFAPETLFPSYPYTEGTLLSFEEQLDFSIRQKKYIKPVVSPSSIYVTPFTTEKWLSFWLNIPAEYRTSRSLFNHAIYEFDKELFSIGTTANYGQPITRSSHTGKLSGGLLLGKRMAYSFITGNDFVHPNMNYIDFGKLMLEHHNLRNTVETLMASLSSRDRLNINPVEIWDLHKSGSEKSVILQNLIAIEAHLRRTNTV